MTDNEIITALKNCGNVGECQKCPLNDLGEGISVCIPHLTQSAVDLIDRQKEQINGLIASQETLQKHLAEKNAEIAGLKVEAEMADEYADALVEYTKSKAIKEFAERLKEKGHIPNEKWNTTKEKAVYESDIDNLVKEMAEE